MASPIGPDASTIHQKNDRVPLARFASVDSATEGFDSWATGGRGPSNARSQLNAIEARMSLRRMIFDMETLLSVMVPVVASGPQSHQSPPRPSLKIAPTGPSWTFDRSQAARSASAFGSFNSCPASYHWTCFGSRAAIQYRSMAAWSKYRSRLAN